MFVNTMQSRVFSSKHSLPLIKVSQYQLYLDIAPEVLGGCFGDFLIFNDTCHLQNITEQLNVE